MRTMSCHHKDTAPSAAGLSAYITGVPFGNGFEGYLGRAFQIDFTFQVQKNWWMDGEAVNDIKCEQPTAWAGLFMQGITQPFNGYCDVVPRCALSSGMRISTWGFASSVHDLHRWCLLSTVLHKKLQAGSSPRPRAEAVCVTHRHSAVTWLRKVLLYWLRFQKEERFSVISLLHGKCRWVWALLCWVRRASKGTAQCCVVVAQPDPVVESWWHLNFQTYSQRWQYEEFFQVQK